MTTILHADHLCLSRAGFRQLMASQPQFEIVAECESEEEITRMLKQLQVDWLVLELQCLSSDVISFIQKLKANYTLKILILTIQNENHTRLIESLIQEGVDAFIYKHVSQTMLLDGLRQVAKNQVYFSPLVTMKLFSKPTRLSLLTEREVEVLRWMATGKSNEKIASTLHISRFTVRKHITNMNTKLGFQSRYEAILFAKSHF